LIDAAIVGAGPAGAASAITLRQAGLSVVILERERFPRDRPGETLHPGIEPLLTQLGVKPDPAWPRHAGHWVEWSAGERRFEAFGQDWRGFQALRRDLDTLLLDRARTLGAEVREGARAVRPMDGGVESIDGRIEARFVIDAAGGGHWLAQHRGLDIVKASPKRLAAYGYSCSRQPGENLFRHEAGGWYWRAQVAGDRVAHVRLRLDGSEPLLPEADSARRSDVTWRRVSPCAGDGYFCVGDAAAVLDPASSHGVAKAIMSGMMAAHLIATGRGTAGYDAWLRDWFERDVRKLQELYRSDQPEPQPEPV
jgi:flavin-dependent dehydrogenase